MLTAKQAKDIRARDEALDAWMKANKTNSYKSSDLPIGLKPPSNSQRSACEVFEFQRDKPETYFSYVREPDAGTYGRNSFQCAKALYGRTGAMTTWTGDNLGTVQFGAAFQDNFGGIRVPITVRAITGELYHGTYFFSAGDYCRVKKAKRQQ